MFKFIRYDPIASKFFVRVSKLRHKIKLKRIDFDDYDEATTRLISICFNSYRMNLMPQSYRVKMPKLTQDKKSKELDFKTTESPSKFNFNPLNSFK